MSGIFKLSSAGGVTSKTRYPNMLTNYGDFGALQRIGYIVGTGSAGEFAFTNIPATYQDLMLVCYVTPTNSAAILGQYLNNDASSIYSETWLKGDGASATSSRLTTQSVSAPVGTQTLATGNPTVLITHILNYANTSTYKTLLSRVSSDQNGSGFTSFGVQSYRSTAAINRISITTLNTSYYWTNTSTFELFGVKASNA